MADATCARELRAGALVLVHSERSAYFDGRKARVLKLLHLDRVRVELLDLEPLPDGKHPRMTFSRDQLEVLEGAA